MSQKPIRKTEVNVNQKAPNEIQALLQGIKHTKNSNEGGGNVDEIIIQTSETGIGQEALDKIRAVLAEIDRANPGEKSLAKLRRTLQEYPEAWRYMGGLAQIVTDHLITKIPGNTKVVQEFVRQEAEEIRHNMGYDHAPMLERLLIEQVTTCWVGAYLTQWKYTVLVEGGSLPTPKADYWERRLSAAQRRYRQACETLARVRKIARRTPTLQVNVAVAGGQQVNVAGDVQAQADGEDR